MTQKTSVERAAARCPGVHLTHVLALVKALKAEGWIDPDDSTAVETKSSGDGSAPAPELVNIGRGTINAKALEKVDFGGPKSDAENNVDELAKIAQMLTDVGVEEDVLKNGQVLYVLTPSQRLDRLIKQRDARQVLCNVISWLGGIGNDWYLEKKPVSELEKWIQDYGQAARFPTVSTNMGEWNPTLLERPGRGKKGVFWYMRSLYFHVRDGSLYSVAVPSNGGGDPVHVLIKEGDKIEFTDKTTKQKMTLDIIDFIRHISGIKTPEHNNVWAQRLAKAMIGCEAVQDPGWADRVLDYAIKTFEDFGSRCKVLDETITVLRNSGMSVEKDEPANKHAEKIVERLGWHEEVLGMVRSRLVQYLGEEAMKATPPSSYDDAINQAILNHSRSCLHAALVRVDGKLTKPLNESTLQDVEDAIFNRMTDWVSSVSANELYAVCKALDVCLPPDQPHDVLRAAIIEAKLVVSPGAEQLNQLANILHKIWPSGCVFQLDPKDPVKSNLGMLRLVMGFMLTCGWHVDAQRKLLGEVLERLGGDGVTPVNNGATINELNDLIYRQARHQVVRSIRLCAGICDSYAEGIRDSSERLLQSDSNMITAAGHIKKEIEELVAGESTTAPESSDHVAPTTTIGPITEYAKIHGDLNEYGATTHIKFNGGPNSKESTKTLTLRERVQDVIKMATDLGNALKESGDLTEKVFSYPGALKIGDWTHDNGKRVMVQNLRDVMRFNVARLWSGCGIPQTKALPDDLRAKGWMVGVHNDYRQDGELMTFWLLTRHNKECVVGEGKTDAEALESIRDELCHRESDVIPDTLPVTYDGQGQATEMDTMNHYATADAPPVLSQAAQLPRHLRHQDPELD